MVGNAPSRSLDSANDAMLALTKWAGREEIIISQRRFDSHGELSKIQDTHPSEPAERVPVSRRNGGALGKVLWRGNFDGHLNPVLHSETGGPGTVKRLARGPVLAVRVTYSLLFCLLLWRHN